MKAGYEVKQYGRPNDLLERISNDSSFSINSEDLNKLMTPDLYVGRSSGQVSDFLDQFVFPLLEKEAAQISEKGAELTV